MKTTIVAAEQRQPPRHVAFIMDGNGRWAQKRGLPREQGHQFGVKAFEKIVEHCRKLGIHAVTVYAFSTENWKRPEKEVKSIMRLMDRYLADCEKKIDRYNFRFCFFYTNFLLQPLTNIASMSTNQIPSKAMNS